MKATRCNLFDLNELAEYSQVPTLPVLSAFDEGEMQGERGETHSATSPVVEQERNKLWKAIGIIASTLAVVCLVVLALLWLHILSIHWNGF